MIPSADDSHPWSKAASLAEAENLARDEAPGTHPTFDVLVRTIWRLRQSDGCPWDRAQTHRSIRANLIEEAYEAADAIDSGHDEHLKEELGDVLMQVLLHAQIASDEGSFDIDEIARVLNEKLIRRHPHVFGDVNASDPDEVLEVWESVKTRERTETSTNTRERDPELSSDSDETSPKPARIGLLDSVPRSLPALAQSQKLSKRVARVGFEWPSIEAVWEQVAQEKAELLAEETGSASWAEELGDLLFSLVNVARWAGVDAEEALDKTNRKFRQRWAYVEASLAEKGISPELASTAQLNELWEDAKRHETHNPCCHNE